jgi:hypothetical protein
MRGKTAAAVGESEKPISGPQPSAHQQRPNEPVQRVKRRAFPATLRTRSISIDNTDIPDPMIVVRRWCARWHRRALAAGQPFAQLGRLAVQRDQVDGTAGTPS